MQKIGASGNPIKTTVTGGAMRVITRKSADLPDDFASSRVSSLTSSQLPDTAVTVDDLSTKDFSSKIGSIAGMISENTPTLVLSSTIDEANPIYLPEGQWNITTTSVDTVPLTIEDISVESGVQIDISIPYAPTIDYALDPEISYSLGFTAELGGMVDLEYSSCMAVNGTMNDTCRDTYSSCIDAPVIYEDEYYECISDGGGCWDIGRWEYVNEYNCPIDADHNLDYSDGRLQDDYEYFGGGNRAYCECIVECRVQYAKPSANCSENLVQCCTES